jgi:hypothetical protein
VQGTAAVAIPEPTLGSSFRKNPDPLVFDLARTWQYWPPLSATLGNHRDCEQFGMRHRLWVRIGCQARPALPPQVPIYW